ncbi:MAG: HIT family protein [Streptosporangiaceae bacterium]
MTDPDCLFCAIIAGRLPSSQVYSDDDVVAFLDIRPLTTGHLLVVPRVHAASLADLPEQAGGRMFAAARRLAAALRASGLPCEGVNLFLADGAVAGQEVFHVHLHVLPRTTGDGFVISAHRLEPARAEMDASAALIRGGLQ